MVEAAWDGRGRQECTGELYLVGPRHNSFLVMDLLPKTTEAFSQKEYWNEFFQKRGTRSFEWYGEYDELCGLLHKYIKPKDMLLIIGCGNSSLGAALYDDGLRNIRNIDISHVVITQMQEANAEDRPLMTFERMDVLDMTYHDGQFTVVLDKGTLDALMPDDTPESHARIDKLFQELDRVLRVGGRYVCVSLLQEHILVKLAAHFPAAGWMLRVCRCLDAEEKAAQKDGGGMPVFVVVCTKFKKMPNVEPVLELSVDGIQLQRVGSVPEVLSIVRGMQQSALVCNRLNTGGSIAGLGPIALDLYRPGGNQARYTVNVLDQIHAGRFKGQFAVFITPQGRETEWLFSSVEGRQTLVKSAGYGRLAMVSMHRNQTYGSLEEIQEELSSSVRTLAPRSMPATTKIPFLSLGSDVGNREVCHQGHSEMSGDYVVEEVKGDGGVLYRRLIFLSNQSVIQSEARLKLVKNRKGKARKVVDVTALACEHHSYMALAVAMAIPPASATSHVAVIGLGGGGLCSFLHHCFSKLKVTAVDIDPAMLDVATKYFGLVTDHRLAVRIQDGIQFIEQAVQKGAKFDAMLFDVDSKDKLVGISCPPQQFLDPFLLKSVKQILHDHGLLVVNLVSRQEERRDEAVATLRDVFPHVCSYKLKEEVNEVIFCSERALTQDNVSGAASIVNAFKTSKEADTQDDLIDLTTFMASLGIGK